MRALVSSIAKILVCLVCLSTATWAFFAPPSKKADDARTSENECLLSVTVSEENENGGEAVEILNASVKAPKTKELTSGTYTVTVTLPRDSAAGYLMIRVGNQTYSAEYIERHTEEVPRTVAFTLMLNDPADVTFTPRLGRYSSEEPSVRSGETLTIS